jgi:hypothetical protein
VMTPGATHKVPNEKPSQLHNQSRVQPIKFQPSPLHNWGGQSPKFLMIVHISTECPGECRCLVELDTVMVVPVRISMCTASCTTPSQSDLTLPPTLLTLDNKTLVDAVAIQCVGSPRPGGLCRCSKFLHSGTFSTNTSMLCPDDHMK